ncbi:hypothetical protein E4U53_005573 [Claviceps sorghi]|nr:hypothetical protein E4U53_005573 [Claviceps sorghi]
MAATAGSASSVPHGFSVYQPGLGAPLEFFPALGSRELDDMMNAFIPGPCAASEKRAMVTLDFCNHARLTGQSFKFYPVQSAATSPATASPSVASTNSSYNASPLTPSWDWSATTAPSTASSSGTPPQRRRESKTRGSASRCRNMDPLSHLPGMKILTKDGVDVTNIASRGSKSKEQRDHAHLMRIIKACDSCRRKKTRCDPSHKKRGAAQSTSQSTSKSGKKAKTKLSDAPPPPPPFRPLSSLTDPANAELLFPASLSIPRDFDFSSTGLEGLDSAELAFDPFQDLSQCPGLNTPDLDLWLNINDHATAQLHPRSSDASSQKSATPSSRQDSGAAPGFDFVDSDSQADPSNLSFMQDFTRWTDYTDFNLYSPSSDFSEDERMLSVSPEKSGLPRLAGPLPSQCPPPPPLAVVTSLETTASNENGSRLFVDGPQFDRGGDSDEIGGHFPATTAYVDTYAYAGEPCSLGTPWPSDSIDMVSGDALQGDGGVALEDNPGGGKPDDGRPDDRRPGGRQPGGLKSSAIAPDDAVGLPDATRPRNTARDRNKPRTRVEQNDGAGLPEPLRPEVSAWSACRDSCRCGNASQQTLLSPWAADLRAPQAANRILLPPQSDNFFASSTDQCCSPDADLPAHEQEARGSRQRLARRAQDASSSLEHDDIPRYQPEESVPGDPHCGPSTLASAGPQTLHDLGAWVNGNMPAPTAPARAERTSINVPTGSWHRCTRGASTRTAQADAPSLVSHNLSRTARVSPSNTSSLTGPPATMALHAPIPAARTLATICSLALTALAGSIAALNSGAARSRWTGLRRQFLQASCGEVAREARLPRHALPGVVSAVCA